MTGPAVAREIGADWWRAEAPAEPTRTLVRGGRAAFAALVAYSVVLIAAPQEFIAGLGPLRIALIFGILAIAAHLIDRMTGRATMPGWPREVKLTMLLLLWAFVMLPFSYWPGGSLEVITQLFMKSVAVFVLLACVVDSTARVRTIAAVLTGCAVVIAVVALDHYRTGMVSAGSGDRIAGYGSSAMAGNPNDLALLLNIVIPVTAGLTLSTRSTSRRLLGIGAIALSIAGIVVTFSRAGFLTLAVTGVLFLWRLFRRGAGMPAAMVAVGAVLVVLLMPSGYADRLSTVSDIDSDTTGSAQGRWKDNVLAAGFFVQHPLIGAGAGMDYLALNELRGPRWTSVHNIYLNYAVDLGVIGLALFLAIYASAWKGIARVTKARPSSDDSLGVIATGVRISLAAFAVGAAFHPIAYHAFFYYLAGLAVAIRRVDERERAQA